MALKAGYSGIKKNMLSTLEALAGLGIKSLGSMFKLSAAGELQVREATATLPGIIKLNDIPTGGGGVDYSTTEQESGNTWIDGQKTYVKVYAVNKNLPYQGNIVQTVESDIALIINSMVMLHNPSGGGGVTYLPCNSGYAVTTLRNNNNTKEVLINNLGNQVTVDYLIIEYVKNT